MFIRKFQIVYQADEENPNDFHWLWRKEALTLRGLGISVEPFPKKESSEIMFRGGSNLVCNAYQQDDRYINTYEEMLQYFKMSTYLPHIFDLSIPTFFADELNDDVLAEIEKREWKKAFIKKDVKALEHIEEGKSIWPNNSFEEMKKHYDEMQIEGKYAIRKCIEKDIIDQEERYWVLNGNIYHRHNNIPDVVKEAAKRLNSMGSKYYTIDATPEFVVEVNPGESSDRHAVNSAELFASWIKKEFVDGK
jgi:hypothetical protein